MYRVISTNRAGCAADAGFVERERFIADWTAARPSAGREPALSVVIPAYNTEAFVARAIGSVSANAALLRLELIVVDDGSTDATARAAARCLDRSAHFEHVVVSAPNRGVGGARNLGLALARGEFVAYLDSDDFVADAIYPKMVAFAQTYGCDQVFCRAISFEDKSYQFNEFGDAWVWSKLLAGRPACVLSPKDHPLLFAVEPSACVRIWRTALARSEHLAFPEGRAFEDIGVHLKAMAASRIVGVVDETGYFYRVGRSGQLTAEKSARRLNVIENVASSISGDLLNVGDAAGAQIVYSIHRIVGWCRDYTPQEHLPDFDREARRMFAKLPSSWTELFLHDYPKARDWQAWAGAPRRRRSLRFWRAALRDEA